MTKHDCAEILLVEDNPLDVELTLRAFKKNKLANPIIVAKDGSEALDFLYRRGIYAGRSCTDMPRVILLDLKLPKVDGLEVLRDIKHNERLKKIPVVVLTSSHEDKDIIESYGLGVNSYIVKPVEFDKFIVAIAEIGMYWLVMNVCPR